MEIQALLGSDIVMAFDQLVQDDRRRREEQAAAMERSMRWAKRSRDAFAGRGRLVRHPAGRARRGPAPGLGRGAHRDRLRRLCGRRPRGRARGRRRCSPASISRCRPAARGRAALSDGRRQARRHRRRGRARHRHVRLRAADAHRAAPARPSPGTARSTSATRNSPRTRRRSTPNRRSPAGRRPISTTSSARARYSARC